MFIPCLPPVSPVVLNHEEFGMLKDLLAAYHAVRPVKEPTKPYISRLGMCSEGPCNAGASSKIVPLQIYIQTEMYIQIHLLIYMSDQFSQCQ